jgi:formylmethanofuran dehydrogenase subunit E
MYDIFFDLDNMHQPVDETTDEYWGIGEVIDLDSAEQLELRNLIEQNKTTTHSNGMNCKDCGEHYPYAEANQSDGSLICYSCRRF